MAATPIRMVRDRLRRDVEAEELRLAVALLDAAELRLRTRLPNADVQLQDDTFRGLFTGVAADAVVRVLVNPDGFRQEAVGPYSWTYDTRAAAGFLTILAEEWEALGVGEGRGAFAVEVTLPPPRLPGLLGSGPLAPYGGTGFWGVLS